MSGSAHPELSAKPLRRVAILPVSRLGRWAVGLALANVVFVLGWRLMGPLGAAPGFAFGLAGGIAGLAAIFRRGERALAVYVAVAPLVLVVVFVLAELLVGHD